MVLLCMLPGVLCWLLYGVAVHVGWCSMMSTVHVGWCSMLTGMGTCRGGGGGGGGELDTLTQMAGGVALSISSLGLMVSTVTLLHDK